ncbi:cellulose biosynthesis protein BcsD [Solimonas variicoloris]|uniref:cellulose biosynthesis protein BcsD n=1 Tax=Solimonas variicoloris TaxID=254408 RepID=UPI000366F60B|nr:cellulose biosynthesis protein BcsD [Solimonas variicoloris]
MDSKTQEYLQRLPRPTAAPEVLLGLGGELASQVQAPQLRGLLYRVGRGLAGRHSVGSIKTLAEFEQFALRKLAELDLGWVQVEEVAGAVDFVHGGAPLQNWFGADAEEWAPGLLEGLYAEWMAQLGADARLDVREIEDGALEPGVHRLRFAHESAFGI